MFPYHVWPAYEYACDRISNITAHVKQIFERRCLTEPEDTLQRVKRINCNVHIIFIYKSEVEEAFFESIFTEIRKCSLREEDGYLYQLPDLLGSKDQPSHDPVFVLSKQSIPFNWDNNLPKDDQMHYVIVQDSVQNSQSLKDDQKCSFSLSSEAFSRIDDLLEEYIFDTARFKAESLQNLKVQTKSVHQYSEMDSIDIDDALLRIRRMYKNSNITDIPNALTEVDKKSPITLEELRMAQNVDRDNIVMVAERTFCLHVYVYIHAIEKEKRNIENKLKNMFNSTRRHFKIIYIEKDFRTLKISPGNSLQNGILYGTIGGFARMYNLGIKRSLKALFSRHVVKKENIDVEMEIQLGPPSGCIMGTTTIPHTDKIDIAAATIRSEDENCVETRFQDVFDRLKYCHLFTYQAEMDLLESIKKYELVFIRGATTGLGRGRNIGYALRYDTPCLIICSREDKPGSEFCQGGDSGAIVCSSDRKGSLYALAILVGEVLPRKSPPEYMAHILQDGLSELSRKHNCTYKWCDESETNTSD